MSQNNLPDNIATPEKLTEDEVDPEDDDVLPSPVEKKKEVLPEKLHRTYSVAEDDHPLAVTGGSTEALRSNTPVKVQKLLSDDLYQEEEVFFREQIQNHIAAIVREAKRRVKNEYGEAALYTVVEHDHPALDEPREFALPKSAHKVVAAARELGYIPNIEVTVNHPENKLITRDNGIGMTTSEVLELWNEPASSGSGADMSSAGKIGIGSLTWVTIAGTEGALIAKTRTRREKTLSGKPVPPRDQQGFSFLAYFGGVLPLSDDVDDGFFGTSFEIPIRDDLSSEAFHSHMENYASILPVQVEWNEIGRTHALDDPEFDPDTFWSRFDSEPAIQIDRPGEFRVALDSPGVVPKGHSTDDTFIMDNPINRNTTYSQSFDTLWNEHIQILNEQGLIVAGPNRGKTIDDVDELYGDYSDLTDDDQPTPDVPLPQPTASRDDLQRDDAHKRFFKYAEQIAIDRELESVSEYINSYLDTDTLDDALAFLRERSTEFELFYKLAKNHKHTRTPKKASRMFQWFDSFDAVDFDANNADPATDEDGNTLDHLDKVSHPKWQHLELLAELRSHEISYAHSGTTGDPNVKENRKTDNLYQPLLMEEKGPIYVGATLNEQRVNVILNTHDDPLIIKTRNYSKWRQPPFDANLVKNVPFHRHDDGADAFDIPDHIHEANTTDDGSAPTTAAGYTPKPEDFEDRPVKIRCTENSAIDVRTTIGELMSALKDSAFDNVIGDVGDDGYVGRNWLVVFDKTKDEKVSDHYNLSQYVATVSCNHSEAEALLQYDSAFSYDDYWQMVTSVELETYNPLTYRTRTRTTQQVLEMDKAPIFVTSFDNQFASLLTESDHDDLPPAHTDTYQNIRDNIIEEMGDRKAELRTREWLVVEMPTEDSIKALRLNHHISILDDRRDDHNYNFGYRTYNQRHWDHAPPALSKIKKNRNRYTKIIKRTQYPAWDNFSDVWGRYNGGYRGPKDREKAMYRHLRDNLGIDPYEHTEEELERVLGHLHDRCTDQ